MVTVSPAGRCIACADSGRAKSASAAVEARMRFIISAPVVWVSSYLRRERGFRIGLYWARWTKPTAS